MADPNDSAADETLPEKWEVEIRTNASWLDLSLRDLWTYRDLVRLFVRRDIVAQYKQTILGPLWLVLQPLLTTVVFTIFFGKVAGLSTAGLPKLLFYLSGQIVWGYFAAVLTVTSDTFVSNAGIFGKVYFPRLVVPVSVLFSQLFQFGLRTLIFLCFFVYFFLRGASVHFTSVLLVFPVALLVMMALSLGLGILFSAMTAKYRDLRFLLAFGVQLLMFTTTAVYPLSAITSPQYRLLVLANPMTSVIECFRQAFTGAGDFHAVHLLYSGIFALVTLFVGVLSFTRIERNFMDSV
jgi:lipopolysaccharide transport system permease protein